MWQGSESCAQCLLPTQALVDQRVTLGVLCGLRRIYQPHSLPPCIRGSQVDFRGPIAVEAVRTVA